MSEPTITCPKCKSEIRLTESLAAPLLEQTRVEFQQRLSAKDLEITRREEAVAKSTAELEQQRSAIEIVERFTEMNEDLDRERKAMTKMWAKREQQIQAVVTSTAGLYGDLQGIAGKAMIEIEALEMPLLADERGS